MDLRAQQIWSPQQKQVLRALAESAARPGCRFLEVGSWCGDSASVFGKVARENDGRLICVDWWRGSDGTDLSLIASAEDVFGVFWQRMRDEGLEDTVVPVRARSDVAADLLREESFDLVFLDGDHRHQGVRDDIRGYGPLVRRPGGLLTGHDCEGPIDWFGRAFLETGKDTDYHRRVHCGVVLAVGEAFKAYSLDHTIWSVRATPRGRWKPANLPMDGIEPPPPGDPIALESYRWYNLTLYDGKVFALSEALGNVDPKGLSAPLIRKHKKHHTLVVGSGVTEVKAAIDRIRAEHGPVYPERIGSYRGFNLVRYGKKVYGLALSLGPVDLLRDPPRKLKDYERDKALVAASTPEEVRQALDDLAAMPSPAGSHKDYNLIRYRGRVHALARSLGDLNLEQLSAGRLDSLRHAGALVVADSTELVIERLDSMATSPVLLGNHLRYNLVRYQGCVYALAASLGELDVANVSAKRLAALKKDGTALIADTIEEARRRLNALEPVPVSGGSHAGYNLIRYRGMVHALATSLGKVDLTTLPAERLESLTQDGALVIAESAERAKEKIDQQSQPTPPADAPADKKESSPAE